MPSRHICSGFWASKDYDTGLGRRLNTIQINRGHTRMDKVTSIGTPPWTRDEIIASIPSFEKVYELRPIKENQGGMRAPHMFATWFIARKLAPKVIVESGILKGQSTWLLENACPDAKLISIDINLSNRAYTSDRATYYETDFSQIDFREIPVESTLAFFDDHQNSYVRLMQCKWLGIKDVIFEDNYPHCQGDVYSLKKAFSGMGFEPLNSSVESPASYFDRIRRLIGSCLGITPIALTPQYSQVNVPANDQDSAMLKRNLDIYYDFPPVFTKDKTRWGDEWEDTNYPTPEPLLEREERESHPVFWDEAIYYTWLCYAKLK